MLIVDSHIHCGIQNVSQPFEDIERLLGEAGIDGACLFSPVEDIYDRHDPAFEDDQTWRTCRRRAHDYLLEIARRRRNIWPYHFAWNDFAVEELDGPVAGIKWHHHAGEPAYRYGDPRCDAFLTAICRRRLPIVLEETFDQTLRFLDAVAGRTAVIIPHLGLLNGGRERLEAAGVWARDDVYADTALASPDEMEKYLTVYGAERLIFGSDYPFDLPETSLERVRSLPLSASDLERVLSGNILGLIRR